MIFSKGIKFCNLCFRQIFSVKFCWCFHHYFTSGFYVFPDCIIFCYGLRIPTNKCGGLQTNGFKIVGVSDAFFPLILPSYFIFHIQNMLHFLSQEYRRTCERNHNPLQLKTLSHGNDGFMTNSGFKKLTWMAISLLSQTSIVCTNLCWLQKIVHFSTYARTHSFILLTAPQCRI